MTGRLLTPDEVAVLLQTNAKTVRRWLRAGRLRGSQDGPGGRWLVSDDDLGMLDVERTAPDSQPIRKSDGEASADAKWSAWLPFPDPRRSGYLSAPIGPGVYQLRRRSTAKLVLFGRSGHVAQRMSSLLPEPFGCGGRNNSAKRQYVMDNMDDIEYRTLPCSSDEEARTIENSLARSRTAYLFGT